MCIKLDDVNSLPNEIIRFLSKPSIIKLFKKYNYIGNEYDDSPNNIEPFIKGVVSEIADFINQNKIVAYHCTKEKYRGYFRENGLEPTEPEKRIDTFIFDYGNKFPENKLIEVKRILYEEWLKESDHINGRAGKIWFCLDRRTVLSDGTEYLFKYYGGEIVYWYLKKRDTEIDSILASIGYPVVVEFMIDTNKLHYQSGDDLAKIILSYYGYSINPSFQIYDREDFTEFPISPDSIINVHDKEVFFSENSYFSSIIE